MPSCAKTMLHVAACVKLIPAGQDLPQVFKIIVIKHGCNDN